MTAWLQTSTLLNGIAALGKAQDWLLCTPRYTSVINLGVPTFHGTVRTGHDIA